MQTADWFFDSLVVGVCAVCTSSEKLVILHILGGGGGDLRGTEAHHLLCFTFKDKSPTFYIIELILSMPR